MPLEISCIFCLAQYERRDLWENITLCTLTHTGAYIKFSED